MCIRDRYKLVSGEEIIGKLTERLNNGRITLQDVRVLMMQQTTHGMGVALLPWMASMPDGKIVLDETKMMGAPEDMDEINSGLREQYLQQTSTIELNTSGIQL